MKTRFIKLAGIILAVALVLTGCSLIKIDGKMQAEEDMENAKKDLSKVIATYDGGEVTKFDVMYDYSYNFAYQSYIYSMYYGVTIDEETYGPDILKGVVEDFIKMKAVLAECEKRGITLTEEEENAALTEGQSNYDDQYASALENVEGETDEIKAMNAEVALYKSGITLDKCVYTSRCSTLYSKLNDALKAEVTELTDEELQTALDAKAAEDEATYSEDLSSFETAMTSADTFVAWRPEGYRTVKHILIKPDDDVLAKVTDAQTKLNTANNEFVTLETELDVLNDDDTENDGERTAADVQAEIDAKNTEIATLESELATAKAECLASKSDVITEIYEKLALPENTFDSVMAEYGEDPGMQTEPTMTTGYYVSAESTTWDPNFRDGAMLLAKVGDYSAEPVIGSSGIHIIYYNSDVVAGPVKLEDCREQFYPIALEDAQTTHATETINSLLEGVNPVYKTEEFYK